MKEEIPTGLNQRISEISKELDQAINIAIKIFRWRRGIASTHNIVKYGGTPAYSFDGEKWLLCPHQWKFVISFDLALPISSEVDACNKLLSEGVREPLGHELFAESWSIRENSPRSSLMIGIAALETGFKECVNKLLPEASWLVMNVASPPIVPMLINFLPALQVKIRIKDKVLAPPKKIIVSLTKGVGIRNLIIHGRPHNLRSDTLEEVLRAIRDVLYLLDLYSGNEWAFKLLSPGTWASLVQEAER